MAAAPIMQYASWAEVHRTPERLLDFAQTLKTELSQQTSAAVSFVAAEVSVGGKPFSFGKHLAEFERQNLDRDDLSADDMRRLHKAAEIMQKISPSWDLADYCNDPRTGDDLKAMRGATLKGEAVATRASAAMLSNDKNEIKTGLMLKPR